MPFLFGESPLGVGVDKKKMYCGIYNHKIWKSHKKWNNIICPKVKKSNWINQYWLGLLKRFS